MPAVTDPSHYHAAERLLDGSMIYLRAIGPDDHDRLLAHFHALSAQSILLRFHGARRSLSEDELTHLTKLDFINHVGLVGSFGEDRTLPIIGVGRYVISERSEPIRAEVGLAVLDAYQGKGIGSILLHHLALIARAAGVEEFQADVRMSNSQMMEVLEHSGYQLRHADREGGVSRYWLTLS
jgi:GNAT superfamily N-acetyltransferase